MAGIKRYPRSTCMCPVITIRDGCTDISATGVFGPDVSAWGDVDHGEYRVNVGLL